MSINKRKMWQMSKRGLLLGSIILMPSLFFAKAIVASLIFGTAFIYGFFTPTPFKKLKPSMEELKKKEGELDFILLINQKVEEIEKRERDKNGKRK